MSVGSVALEPVIPRASPTLLGAHRKRSHTRVIFSFSTLPKPSQGCPITFSMSMMNLRFRNPLQKNHPFFPESLGNSPLFGYPQLRRLATLATTKAGESLQLQPQLSAAALADDVEAGRRFQPKLGGRPLARTKTGRMVIWGWLSEEMVVLNGD